MKINKRIGITFIIVIVIINLISLTLMNILNHNSFNTYLNSEKTYISKEVNSIIDDYYKRDSDKLYEKLENYSITEEVYIKVEDKNKVIFESDEIEEKHRGMGMHSDDRNGMNYEEITVSNGNLSITIGQNKNHMQSNSEAQLMSGLTQAHFISFIISIVVGVIATIIVSRQFSKPIMLLNQNLKYISKGYYNYHEDVSSNIYEINQLDLSSKQIRNALSEQEQIRDQLVTNLSHDLRTPLTVIKTNIEAMGDGVIDINEENLEVASKGLERVISIVGQLDSLTNMSGGSNATEKINVSKETENVIDIFNQVANKKQIEITKSVVENIYMPINVDYYSQIVSNLLSNAIKYNVENGKINIILEKVKNNVILEVSDTGIGIDQSEIPYIFDRFYRCDKSRSEEDSSGVGLSIVKSLVELNNGEIFVSSDENQTTFKIVFKPEERVNE